MIGTRERIAISCARRIFLIVSGHHEPALTVASLATTTTSRPPTRPTAVTTPAAGAAAVVLVVGDEQADLLRVRVLVEQKLDALARRQLPLLVLLLYLVRAAARAQSLFERAQLARQLAQARALPGARRGCFATHLVFTPAPPPLPRDARGPLAF